MSFHDLASLLSEVTGAPVHYRPRPAADLLPLLLKQGMEPSYAAGLAEGVAALEAAPQPLADTVYDDVARITGRAPVTWRDFATKRLASLPARS